MQQLNLEKKKQLKPRIRIMQISILRVETHSIRKDVDVTPHQRYRCVAFTISKLL